jgi:hypothetical protein
MVVWAQTDEVTDTERSRVLQVLKVMRVRACLLDLSLVRVLLDEAKS